MAGYRITYDGSNVDRRDVPQATGNSSLTSVGNVAPYEFNTNQSAASPAASYGQTPIVTGDVWSLGAPFLSMTSPITAWSSFPYNQQGNYNSKFEQTGGVGQTFGPNPGNSPFQMVFLIPNSLSGQSVTVEVRSIARGTIGEINPLNGKPTTGFTGPANTGAFQTFSHTFTVSSWGALVWFESTAIFSNHYISGIDYIRVIASTGVTIFDSTDTAGVAPSGTTGVVESVTTDTQGQAAVAGPPKDFGINVIHNASTIAEAGFLPSAQNTEDASKDVATSKIITATDTSVTVEAFGLGGAERLAAGETKIVVEDLEDTTEN